MSSAQGTKKRDKRIFSGICPDFKCQARLFFPAYSLVSIECTECGQRHEQKNLLNVEEVTDPDVVLHNLLRNALLDVTGAPKKSTELVKVMGLSNYHCKLLSPILTRYGMDKQTGKAKLLREMNQGELFDCSLLGGRAFLIEQEHVSTVGYGKDRSGSLIYLHDTLEELKKANNNKECLIPVHVDGDGHCLVHAVSRALVGRELFWHALRENLKFSFKQNLDRYKALFQDFIDTAEWEDIINECDPLFVPPEGVPLGLRNIHIFGLANVLHRPIILLDSLSGMRSSGDYSATFLPGLVPEEQCRGKDGSLNKPICIAWSSSGRNHYLPLVGIKGMPLPKLPAALIPKAWGVPQELICRYVSLEVCGGCVIGGDRSLQEKYLLRLVSAMEDVFIEKHGIHPALVADVHQYVYRRTGVIGIQPEEVTEAAKKLVQENRLHRCLMCNALSELHVPPEWLEPGGKLYNLAKSTHGTLRGDKNYTFPLNNVVCSYCPERDALVPDYKLSSLSTCTWCHRNTARHVRDDGSIVYLDGDRTNTRSQGGKCGCGFKHFWDGKEYDNLPEAFPITLEWGGRVVRETVYWFQYELDPALNSNVYNVAMRLVTKHFPGEFGSEILVQKVVNTVLHHTAKKNPEEYHPVTIEAAHMQGQGQGGGQVVEWDANAPQKIILTGQKGRTLHKEELCIRHGFPPRELPPPPLEHQNLPVALQHGDRITVEVLQESVPDTQINTHIPMEPRLSRTSSRDIQDSVDLEMSSLCLLATLMGEDVWSYAKKLPHLFQQGGVFYNIVKKDMGLFDGKHCTLPHLTGKTFVFNAAEERLELCVDAAGHFPVGPNVEEIIQEALSQLCSEAPSRNPEGSPVHGLKLGSGGVVRKKEQSVTAFQGKGHSLGSTSHEHQPIRREHSNGVDMSGSVQGEGLARSREELVRVAPGMLTMREGCREVELEPTAIEAQRRRLQEMVSNIQASMDKHLRQQTTPSTITKQDEKEDGLDEQDEIKSQGAESQSPSISEPMDQSL
ncbi:hypothetical protein AMELA_G00217500 [Ameiurus melas]|uniref:OTU domain-containing protein n=1 Tax=Ameiurus melas TaxID=219545 RepID=A0A7J6A1M9_AMEME|nr:hypothetical protein AMELA_G00217500 [Ameiurus melas]